MGRAELKQWHDRVFFKALMDVIQHGGLKYVQMTVDGKEVTAIYCDAPAFAALKFTMEQFLDIKKQGGDAVPAGPTITPIEP